MPIYSLIDHLSVGPYDEALSPPDGEMIDQGV